MRNKILMTLVALFTMMAGAWADGTVFEYADPMVGTLTQGTTGTSATTVTINSKSVNAIKFGNTYKYADGKYITIAPTSGSFKKGDVVSIAGCISNGSAEVYAKAGIYTADGATQLYETANVVNAQLSTDAPVVETYTLTQDAEKLLIARSTGTTALYITTLKVMRTPAAPEVIELKPDETGKNWILADMPAYDIELQVEYYTESNLFLSKEALKDKASIAVTAGELGVQFGEDGKSANPVTEGTAMTVKYNGAKKILGMKVAKKKTAPKLLTLNVGGVTIYYAEGDSWANAISRDENKDSGLFIREGNRVHHSNYGQLVDSNTEAVLPEAIINANESYRFIK